MPALLLLLLTALAAAAEMPRTPLELILHDPAGHAAPSEACEVRLCTSLLELIEGARERVDFAIYGLRGQPAVLDALRRAQARGVVVRGVVDRTVDGRNYYADTDRLVEALGTVRDDLATDRATAARRRPYDPRTSRCWLEPSPGHLGPRQCVGIDLGDRCLLAVHASREALTFTGHIMHHKFLVADGRYVWTGSTNVSDSGVGGYNANLAAVVDSPEVARWYTAEFEALYGGRHHLAKAPSGPLRATLPGGVRVEGWFSPQDRPLTRAVRPLIQGARERIDVAVFYLTDKAAAADLVAAHLRGVRVRVLVDATSAVNAYTKHELLRAAGIPVKVESWGGKMHMKTVAVDGRALVVGSMNWTSAGERGNDENTLVIHSAAHAEQLHAAFERLWASVPDRWLTGRPDPESPDSGTACTDGVDDDFDGLVDADDPGCGPHPPPLPGLPPYRVVPKLEGQPLVKGDVTADGQRLYHLPGQPSWDRVVVTPGAGDAYFCSVEDARAAGFRAARTAR